MDEDGVWAELLFPTFPRFGGTQFLQAEDKDLALAMVRAWNDWMLDEWCAAYPERFIPQTLVPLWDVPAAVAEIERCAEKGSRAVLFVENPHHSVSIKCTLVLVMEHIGTNRMPDGLLDLGGARPNVSQIHRVTRCIFTQGIALQIDIDPAR